MINEFNSEPATATTTDKQSQSQSQSQSEEQNHNHNHNPKKINIINLNNQIIIYYKTQVILYLQLLLKSIIIIHGIH